MKALIIMFGPSGSGKSHRAEELAKSFNNSIICSTDHYWYDSKGNYNFDATKLGYAHDWNQKRVEAEMKKPNGADVIIVDNTNLASWERKPYETYAKNNGFEIQYEQSTSEWWKKISENLKKGIVCEEDVDILVEKNQHGVPRETIRKMLTKLQFPI